MDSQNTILIDDSPKKCMCNDSGNCLFLETWNTLDAFDDFLPTYSWSLVTQFAQELQSGIA
jgi:hypothetical protein